MDKLGFTFYPQDWWTSDSFFEFDPFERYVYLECLFLMYRNDGYMKTQKTQFENRIGIRVSNEIWEKITARFIKSEIGFTSLTVNKRLKKALISQTNGLKGGRPKKAKTQKTQGDNLKGKGIESESEKELKRKLEEDAKKSEWISWGELIVRQQDQFWDSMRGRKITQEEMNQFLSVATRNNWKMETQQDFRVSLNGFTPTNGRAKGSTKNAGKIQ